MARKFISFLGTGNYQLCKYRLSENEISDDVIFIQEALVKFLCTGWTKDDSICIFVTKEARAKHWDALESQLKKLNLPCEPKAVDIEDSKTEADIWRLFKTLYDAIEANDSIIFDLTHSFRYLPMLFFSILNYAQYLKHSEVTGIYYGAYEARNQETNIAPIFNMTDSYQVLQWASAADAFTNYGIADKLHKLADEQDSELSNAVMDISKNMSYARGKKIIDGKMFSKCQEQIDRYIGSSEDARKEILRPILSTVENKISAFGENSAANFIPAVQWYIDHDMRANAISMMKEGCITYLLVANGIDFNNAKLRLTMGQRLAYCAKGEFRYDSETEPLKKKIESIMGKPYTKEIKDIIEGFNQSRNDIDHSGFVHPSSYCKLNNTIQESFDRIKEIIEYYGDFDASHKFLKTIQDTKKVNKPSIDIDKTKVYTFTGTTVGTNKNLKGALDDIPELNGILKASIPRKRLAERSLLAQDCLGKQFKVTIEDMNPQGDGWVLNMC